MIKRYFEVSEVPDVLFDWLNEKVTGLIEEYWEDNKQVAWTEVEDGKMVLTVAGPGKATVEDPSGDSDIYTLSFDILEQLKDYSDPYEGIGGPCSDEQREDMRERAAMLRKMADSVADMADRAAKAGQ